jgi:hypothetical protein
LKVRERAFPALTKQYEVEFFDPFWTTSLSESNMKFEDISGARILNKC